MTESRSFEMTDVTRFTTGTVGPKGQRTFYLQVANNDQNLSLKLEKQQVHALAEYLDTMMVDLPSPLAEEMPFDLELADPVVSEWVVASMGVAYSESQGAIILWAEELVDEEDPEMIAPATARVQVSLAQAEAFVHRARKVIGAGRPPCDFCGTAVNDDTGWCPCLN